MKSRSLTAVVTIFIGILGREICAHESDSPRALQILTPVNHSFHLELTELKSILEHDDIKDHNVVVVSIGGAFRQGKSFLLNFFIKYLNAQVSAYFFLMKKKRTKEKHREIFDAKFISR